MRKFGLIGYPLSHSFSKKFFAEKFTKENITDCSYDNYELREISDFPALIKAYPALQGLNVTIPYKQKIIPYLDNLDHYAGKIGAVNVIRFHENGHLIGHNSDYYGFRKSLEKWIGPAIRQVRALVLGTGGAAKAILAVLEDCNVNYKTVSRRENKGDLTYGTFTDDPELILAYRLIINTTPVGMYPDVNEAPNLPYDLIDSRFYLFDLIYNPDTTLFLQKGQDNGAKIKNGMEMLVFQAERSWEIWNK